MQHKTIIVETGKCETYMQQFYGKFDLEIPMERCCPCVSFPA